MFGQVYSRSPAQNYHSNAQDRANKAHKKKRAARLVLDIPDTSCETKPDALGFRV